MLLTFDAFDQLIGRHRVLDRLAEPVGVEDVELSVPRSTDRAEPARFD